MYCLIKIYQHIVEGFDDTYNTIIIPRFIFSCWTFPSISQLPTLLKTQIAYSLARRSCYLNDRFINAAFQVFYEDDIKTKMKYLVLTFKFYKNFTSQISGSISLYPSVCLSVRPSVCMYVRPSLCMSVPRLWSWFCPHMT